MTLYDAHRSRAHNDIAIAHAMLASTCKNWIIMLSKNTLVNQISLDRVSHDECTSVSSVVTTGKFLTQDKFHTQQGNIQAD